MQEASQDAKDRRMEDFFVNLLNTEGFPARWHCGSWDQFHGWMHIISDCLIFGAYLAIPVSISFYITRRKDAYFHKLYWLFACFILSCGIGHLIEATIFWHPWYRLSGLVKAITAAVSWGTVVVLIRMLPTAMALPGTARMNEVLQQEVRERRQAEQAAMETGRQLRQALEERNRLGRDLHDGIIQSVYAVGLRLENLSDEVERQSPEQTKAKVHAALEAIDSTISTIRGYILQLESNATPATQTAHEILQSGLQRVVESYGGTQASRITLQIDNRALDAIPPATASHLLFLAREALSNAVRHAHATAILVRFRWENDVLLFEIRDNGIGFDARSESNGHGLINMKARTAEMAGLFHLESGRGHGTLIRVVLPVVTRNSSTAELEPSSSTAANLEIPPFRTAQA